MKRGLKNDIFYFKSINKMLITNSIYTQKYSNMLSYQKKSDSRFLSLLNRTTFLSKRSQTTVIIILSILIFGSVLLLFYFNKSDSRDLLPENKARVDNAKAIVSFCIENAISDSLERVGFQGGYYEKPEYYYDLGDYFLTYYYYHGKILSPSINKIEGELEKSVSEELLDCRELETDFELDFGKPKTRAFIRYNEIEFNIDYPVIINLDDDSTTIFKRHYITRESALRDMTDMAVFMTESRKDSEFDCISCLSKMAEEKNLYLDIYNFNDDTIVKIYENYTIDEQSLMFLNKFDEKIDNNLIR